MKNDFGVRLQKCLDFRGKKAIDVAVNCGFSRGMMSCYLQGKRKPKFDRLNQIADYLEVSVAYLMGLTNSMISPVVSPLNSLGVKSRKEILIDEIIANLTWLNEETIESINSMVRTLAKDKKPQ